MMSNRFGAGPPSAIRKSRLEGKPSLLPVMRRPGSSDRISTEAPRPSTTFRSSSADPPVRSTFGGGRLSREVSATKLSINRRSRTQTSESKYGHNMVTPLRSGQRLLSTTPRFTRTPDDKSGQRWQMCLERALAYVTVKDQRPITSIGWQRAEYARVSAALGDAGTSGGALVRPLTIARFVNIVSELLIPIHSDVKLTTDNYITKLPHLAKRLLYPAPVSKSWLRAVNTLHAFPHALALIGYLLDLAVHCQMPVSDESLYVCNDEVAVLRRDYVTTCWLRFNHESTDSKFDDLHVQYAENLKKLFGNDEEKLKELHQDVKKCESMVEDEELLAARAEQAWRVGRRDALAAELRELRVARRAAAAERDHQRALRTDRVEALRTVDADVERARAEIELLRAEVQQQSMSAEERARLLEEVDYSNRVCDSKRALARQLSETLQSKETELAELLESTLASCMQYNHGLAQLSAQLPAMAALTIDEKDLMSPECAQHMVGAVETMKEECGRLATRKAELQRTRSALARKKAQLLEETRDKIAEMKTNLRREQDALDEETYKEANAAAVWGKEQQDIRERLQQLQASQEESNRLLAELDLCEKKESRSRLKLEELHKYIAEQKVYARQKLVEARERRLNLVGDTLALWNSKLDEKQSDPAQRIINM